MRQAGAFAPRARERRHALQLAADQRHGREAHVGMITRDR